METTILKFYDKEGNEIKISNPWRKELAEMLSRQGLPGDLQRDIYKAVLPVLARYRTNETAEMNNDRILGLATESLREAFFSARRSIDADTD